MNDVILGGMPRTSEPAHLHIWAHSPNSTNDAAN